MAGFALYSAIRQQSLSKLPLPHTTIYRARPAAQPAHRVIAAHPPAPMRSQRQPGDVPTAHRIPQPGVSSSFFACSKWRGGLPRPASLPAPGLREHHPAAVSARPAPGVQQLYRRHAVRRPCALGARLGLGTHARVCLFVPVACDGRSRNVNVIELDFNTFHPADAVRGVRGFCRRAKLVGTDC